ncbi:trehalose operon repressor [uncultured Lactobacillus sp.]|uniref:trehalose operon repressor n=1 Tax=uncultured Lactobacillus sp. TaxID=153152 RepID=UPI00261F42F1|nr:trehalose operon repressor [uncultured Lactobacillus sp.]
MQSKSDIIAQDLASKIKHQLYKPGNYIPSENQLTALYGSSRETVRRALDQLTELGLIQKIKGKGSLVLNLERYSFPISGITSFAELNKDLDMRAETKILTFEKCSQLPEKFLPYFSEEKDSKGTHVERLRIIQDQPDVLDCDYLLNPPIADIPKSAAEKSIYQYLENDLGLSISYATKEITVTKVDDHIQKLLQLDHELAVLVASRNYLEDTTKFELTLSYHRPDKFKFVDFARRKHIKL